MPPLHGGVVVSCRSPNLRFRRLAFRHRIECAAKNSDATAIRPCENWYRVLNGTEEAESILLDDQPRRRVCWKQTAIGMFQASRQCAPRKGRRNHLA